MAELLLILSKLLGFTWNNTRILGIWLDDKLSEVYAASHFVIVRR